VVIVIPLSPITKKNSQKIIWNKKLKRPMVIPSDAYRAYEKNCFMYMPKVEAINRPVNVKALFYMPTHRVVDLVNLEEALLDVLVKYRVLEDDNSRIVRSMDGSLVLYDKDNPRTEVTIEEWETCATEITSS